MRKIILTVLGLFSLVGIIQILSALYLSIVQFVMIGNLADPDALQASVWLILPTILSIFLFYKGLKDPSFYDKYKKTFSFFFYGLIVTVIVGLILSVVVLLSGDPFGFLMVVGVMLMGVFISLVLAIIGWFLDRKKR